MLNIFITVDVEIWCGTWHEVDQNFPKAFQSQIYGPTKKGNYGLPLKLKILNDHGLQASFFVEPLFSTRFGKGPLEEIIGLIKEYRQDIQLHLHTEWVDEAKTPIIPNSSKKRQYIKYFSLEEQKILIKKGIDLLTEAGGNTIKAFRAGSFAANLNSLKALNYNNIFIDSSYNLALKNHENISPSKVIHQPQLIEGVYEYPMTVFRDGINRIRHAQLAACSTSEIVDAIKRAEEANWNSFIILSHNFELLNRSRTEPEQVVTRRLIELCQFLEKQRDLYKCVTFNSITPTSSANQPKMLTINRRATLRRLKEQLFSRIF